MPQTRTLLSYSASTYGSARPTGSGGTRDPGTVGMMRLDMVVLSPSSLFRKVQSNGVNWPYRSTQKPASPGYRASASSAASVAVRFISAGRHR
jgi:hypothetical protein